MPKRTQTEQESGMDLDSTIAAHDYLRTHFRGRIGRVYLTLCEHDVGAGVEMRMRELSALTGLTLPPLRESLRLLRIAGLIEVKRVYWPRSEGIKTSRYRVLPVDASEVS
jgi:hypothetical protein